MDYVQNHSRRQLDTRFLEFGKWQLYCGDNRYSMEVKTIILSYLKRMLSYHIHHDVVAHQSHSLNNEYIEKIVMFIILRKKKGRREYLIIITTVASKSTSWIPSISAKSSA